jgi:hypothetical protein
MNKKSNLLYWLPRVLAILFIIFISLFSFDVFQEGYGFWQAVLAFLIHLVPSYILTAALLVAWKWEKIGGLIFLALGLWYLLMTYGKPTPVISILIIGGPPFLIGLLFLFAKKK